jgi:hypothetical protein
MKPASMRDEARVDSPFGNIEVRGARENNLKDISLDIPRRPITVFTGVSAIFARTGSPLTAPSGCSWRATPLG